LDAGEHTLLLQPEEHVPSYGGFDEFLKPGTNDNEHSSVREVAGQVSEQLPRRRIRQVHVVEQNDRRPFSSDVP
jgi:hypothetical protein